MAEDALLAEMRALRDRVVGITDTALASRDGLIVRADTGTIDPDNLAALAAAMLGVAQRIAAEVGQGSLHDAVVKSSGGYVATYAVGGRALLVVVGDTGVNRGLLYRESRSAVDHLESLLAEASSKTGRVATGKDETGEIRHD